MLDEVETEEQSHEEPGLREAFGRILTAERFSDHINAIVDLLSPQISNTSAFSSPNPSLMRNL